MYVLSVLTLRQADRRLNADLQIAYRLKERELTGAGRRVEGKQSVAVFDFARLYPNLDTTLGPAGAGWRKGSRTEDRSMLPKTNRISVCNPSHLVRGNMEGMQTRV